MFRWILSAVGATNQKLSRNEILDLAIRLNRIRFEALQVFDFRYPDAFSEDTFREFVERAHLSRALEEPRRAAIPRLARRLAPKS